MNNLICLTQELDLIYKTLCKNNNKEITKQRNGTNSKSRAGVITLESASIIYGHIHPIEKYS